MGNLTSMPYETRTRLFLSAGGAAALSCRDLVGAVAQLGERYNGIVEVVGSIPSGSTSFL